MRSSSKIAAIWSRLRSKKFLRLFLSFRCSFRAAQRRRPSGAARPGVVRHQALSARAKSADDYEQRDEGRPKALPSRQSEVPDFYWLSIPVEVAAPINPEAVEFALADGPDAARPRLLVRLPKWDLI
jgi:hypothetical protein